METLSLRRQLAYTLLLFLLLVLLVPQAGHAGDVGFWIRWATYIQAHGLGNVYQVADNNYNPLYHYILWLFGALMGTPHNIEQRIHSLKVATLVFDFAGAFWAASLVAGRHRRFESALLLLLNIGYLYNSLLWLQIDSIYTFFAFGAVVLAAQRRSAISLLLFVLALATKTQAIIFLPPLLLLWLPQWWQQPQQLVRAGLGGAILLLLLLAPFVWWSAENYLPRIITINLHATQTYPSVSPSACNFWYLVSPPGSAMQNVSDQLPFAAGLTYRTWGLLLFFASAAVALLPLLVAAWRTASRPPAIAQGPSLALALLSCGCVPLLFCFFNTQMHERYWHSAVLFLGAYSLLRRDYLPYILVSVAYVLNLECVLRYFELSDYGTLIFNPRFVAAIFALAIGLVIKGIYQLAPWRTQMPAPAIAHQVAV